MAEKSRVIRLVVSKPPPPPEVGGIYLITDQHENLLERVESAFRGGVSVLQYRAKETSPDVKLQEGKALKDLCRRYKVLFIVNDDLNLAAELDAGGVHLGQDDGEVEAAREILGDGKVIGKSTHSLEEALQAEKSGADYIGFGAMYPTSSKTVTHIPGTSGLSAIRDHLKIPVVAIGGITTSNACRVIDAGADAIAVISSVLSSSRPDIAAAELKLLFNRLRPFPRGNVMTVAGSDSGGGAGIQADIKTITLLGSYACSAITALTAQNTRGVNAIHGMPVTFVKEQLDAVLSDIPVDIIKTGMLHTPSIIEMLSERFAELMPMIPLIVDPVMVAKGGASLMERDSIRTFCDLLLPLAYLITPNIPEAEKLLGRQIRDEVQMERAARDLHGMGAANVLIKGGHLGGHESVDILFDGSAVHRFSSERFFTGNTHGTGCTCSSAIASFLAQGEPLKVAVQRAKDFISAAIRLSRPLGKGHGPVNHYLAANETAQR